MKKINTNVFRSFRNASRTSFISPARVVFSWTALNSAASRACAFGWIFSYFNKADSKQDNRTWIHRKKFFSVSVFSYSKKKNLKAKKDKKKKKKKKEAKKETKKSKKEKQAQMKYDLCVRQPLKHPGIGRERNNVVGTHGKLAMTRRWTCAQDAIDKVEHLLHHGVLAHVVTTFYKLLVALTVTTHAHNPSWLRLARRALTIRFKVFDFDLQQKFII